jgi:hypothetical protein
MVFFKWLEMTFGILGGLIGVVVLWKAFAIPATLRERAIFSMRPGNLLGVFWAILTAHAICAIVIHQESNERILYGTTSLLLVAVALVKHLVALKPRESAPIE